MKKTLAGLIAALVTLFTSVQPARAQEGSSSAVLRFDARGGLLLPDPTLVVGLGFFYGREDWFGFDTGGVVQLRGGVPAIDVAVGPEVRWVIPAGEYVRIIPYLGGGVVWTQEESQVKPEIRIGLDIGARILTYRQPRPALFLGGAVLYQREDIAGLATITVSLTTERIK